MIRAAHGSQLIPIVMIHHISGFVKEKVRFFRPFFVMRRIISILICCILIAISAFVPVSAYTPSNFDVDAEGALLVNIDTGDILYSKNPDKRLYPASLTKLMTALILYENTADLDGEKITVTEHALALLDGTDSSIGGLIAGEVLTVRQMLYVLLLSSANDGANAIAEHVSGTISKFVELMNAKAASLGMNDTHYANAHGLHDTQHYTTVNDMYKLTTAFLSVPLLKEIVYSVQFTLPATNKSKERSFVTTNMLMLNDGQKSSSEKYKNQLYYYKYARGVKTGYTDAAGRCLISTAGKNGYNYLCILMNCPVYNANHKKIRVEFGDTKALYEWAFNEFEYKKVLKGSDIIAEAKVNLSWDTDYVSVCPAEDLSAIVPKVADSSTLGTEIRWYKKSFDAPIKKGEALGECDIIYAGEKLGTVELVASKNVRRSIIMYVGHGIKKFFAGVVGSPVFWVFVILIAAAVTVFIAACVMMNRPRRRRRRKY